MGCSSASPPPVAAASSLSVFTARALSAGNSSAETARAAGSAPLLMLRGHGRGRERATHLNSGLDRRDVTVNGRRFEHRLRRVGDMHQHLMWGDRAPDPRLGRGHGFQAAGQGRELPCIGNSPHAFCCCNTIGRLLIRCPVSAKIAFTTAGAIGGVPGSPTPPGPSVLGTMCTSTTGISFIRSIG